MEYQHHCTGKTTKRLLDRHDAIINFRNLTEKGRIWKDVRIIGGDTTTLTVYGKASFTITYDNVTLACYIGNIIFGFKDDFDMIELDLVHKRIIHLIYGMFSNTIRIAKGEHIGHSKAEYELYAQIPPIGLVNPDDPSGMDDGYYSEQCDESWMPPISKNPIKKGKDKPLF